MKRNLLLPMMLLLAGGVFGPSVKAQNWSGTSVEDATKSETVYLWNVGAKQFLGKGGRWGTQAILSNVGTPFKIVEGSRSNKYFTTGTYRLESVVKGQNSKTSGCLEFMNADEATSTHDTLTYFVDRGVGDRSTLAFTFSGNKTAYQLKITSSAGPTSCQGDFYLFAKKKNAEVKGNKALSDDDKAYSQWIIVTEDTRKEIFKQAEASSSSAVDATFLMFDNGFDRNDNNVTNWQTSSARGKGLDGTLSWANNGSLDKHGDFWKPTDANPDATVKVYTYTYTGSHYYYYYGYKTHSVTYTVTTITSPDEQPTTLTISCGGGSDNEYHSTQDVKVTLDKDKTVSKDYEGYTYYNGNGYVEGNETTVDEDGNLVGKNKLHEQLLYGGDWTANIHGSYGVVNQTVKNDNMIRDGWYKVSCVGFTTATKGTAQLYVSSGTGNELEKYYAVQNLNKISADEAPATYVKASKLINGGGYEASAMVYIDNNTENKLKTLSFGIRVDDADDTAWTCFDNFQIEYLGKPTQVLVLDEDQSSVDYINAQTAASKADNVKRTLYLHRTVNAKKWNSIVLPVSLTVGQVKSAFGDGVHISEFQGAINENIPGRMYFETVNVDRSNNNAVAIEEGKLYIIKPDVEEPTGKDAIAFPEKTKITKELTSYFTIVGVTFNDELKDFDAKVEGKNGDETNEGAQVQFVGTYVADTDKDHKQIPANSYVLKGNKGDEAGLWFYRTVPTSTKGFRGWLQTLGNTNESKISFSINGVVSDDEATGIDAIDAELNGNAVNGNVYNLSGQLVRRNATSLEGLAKGVYIHNGKKFIVK